MNPDVYATWCAMFSPGCVIVNPLAPGDVRKYCETFLYLQLESLYGWDGVFVLKWAVSFTSMPITWTITHQYLNILVASFQVTGIVNCTFVD